MLSSGCIRQEIPEDEMAVQHGDTVTIDFTGRLTDKNNTVVMTTDINTAKEEELYVLGNIYQPYTFTVGDEHVYQGLNEGIIGMVIGETKTTTIPPEKGAGMPMEELFVHIPLSEAKLFSRGVPSVGSQIVLNEATLSNYTGLLIPEPFMKGRVVQVNDTHILVDFNYPYTGKTIILEITVRSILRDT
ncbi:MAG: FKBP-type peptidyl-prolyl cis-trans isomerase [Methanosarcinales archaeon]|nr:FKBP-type peptidyl-prolyl cis-trans isomerase [ANME-2 cluster archaeon]MDW7775971.1 FKBP-type peptidyl-prolyl cis-trans isomerase [Methanosarcinales archaeon]